VTDDRRVRAAALGIAILLIGVVSFGLLSRPPAPARTVEIETLDQAVGVGLLDAEVLAELRASGQARAIVHLDTEAIIGPIRRAIGEDRTAALIDAMTAAFKANKATLGAAFGTDIEVVGDFDRLGALVVTIHSEEALLAALRSQLVAAIGGDVPAPPTRDGRIPSPLPQLGTGLGAPSVFEGAGVAIGVLDTGVDTERYPAYFPGGSVVQAIDTAPLDGAPDDDGHGTHVASTVLLMAPQAKLYVADVFRKILVEGELESRAFNVDVLAAMDWLIGLRQSGVNIRAVNLSLGYGHFPPDICVDRYHFAEALAAGIIPVVSAGNSAFEDDDGKPTLTWQPGLGSTACNESALSVGAVTNGGCPDGSFDVVAPFSQSGPGLDVLAPGVCIVAAGGSASGTSMAAPHVSGAVAALANAKPPATATEIWSALTSVGPLITDPNSGVARHRLDIPAAVDYLLGTTVPRPTPVVSEIRGVAVGVAALSPSGVVRPGQRVDFEPFAVRNVGTVATTYDVTVEAPTGGFVSTAPASWFSIAPSSLDLEPGSLGEVRLTVRPADDAAAGVYAARVVVADRLASAPGVADVVDVSFVVFDDAAGGGSPGGGGSSGPGDAGDEDGLLENPVVIVVGILLVMWALRRLFGSRRGGTGAGPSG
jgi:hypothetical protein